MTPEEEVYEKALRRIREAEDAGALELDLRGAKEGETGAWEVTEFEPLNRLPPELERLTSLQWLNLFECWHLSGDLSPWQASPAISRGSQKCHVGNKPAATG